MDQLQDEVTAAGPAVAVQILGVNAPGSEAGNATVTQGRDLPWLQDTVQQDVAGAWGVTFRDVVVLDGQNHPYAIYNLSEHNLADPVAYDKLRDILLAAAEASVP